MIVTCWVKIEDIQPIDPVWVQVPNEEKTMHDSVQKEQAHLVCPVQTPTVKTQWWKIKQVLYQPLSPFQPDLYHHPL